MSTLSTTEQAEALRGTSGLLKTAHARIAELIEENGALREENKQFKLEKQAEAIIIEAESKGHAIVTGDTMQEKVASLLESKRNLNVVEEAIKLAADNTGSFGLGGDAVHGGGNSLENLVSTIMGES